MVDMTNDVNRFEELFKDRFTEKDSAFMELKSKSLSHPVVIHPWRSQRKQWNKRWDYRGRRNQDNYHDRDRNDDRRRQSSYDRPRDQSRGGSSRGYRDRSQDKEHSRDKHDHPRDRHDHSRDRHDHSKDGSKSRDRGNYDYQAALKSYSER